MSSGACLPAGSEFRAVYCPGRTELPLKSFDTQSSSPPPACRQAG